MRNTVFMVNQVTMSVVVLVKVLLIIIIIFVVLMTIIIITSCKISQAFCEDSFDWKCWHQLYILIYWNILSNISNIAGVLRGLFWRRLRAAVEEGSRRAADRQALEKRSHHWGHLDCNIYRNYASLISILPPQKMNFQFSWNSRNLQIWKLKLENLIK